MRKFLDLIASEELYFRRTNLFTDKSEGLPPKQYARRDARREGYVLTVAEVIFANRINAAAEIPVPNRFLSLVKQGQVMYEG
jgi:hypothetical protein